MSSNNYTQKNSIDQNTDININYN